MRPACVTGEFPIGAFGDEPRPGWRMRPGHDLADRHRWLKDVVLHEMVHQRLNQLNHPGRHDQGGHGPAFTAECNRIGEMMGLPAVKPRGRKGKDIPISSQWPLCVRPSGMYGHYYGDLWEFIEDETRPLTQFDKLCATFEGFVAVWKDPRTTEDDIVRFKERYGLGRKTSDETVRLVITGAAMELAA